jgi:hypothetical protein
MCAGREKFVISITSYPDCMTPKFGSFGMKRVWMSQEQLTIAWRQFEPNRASGDRISLSLIDDLEYAVLVEIKI